MLRIMILGSILFICGCCFVNADSEVSKPTRIQLVETIRIENSYYTTATILLDSKTEKEYMIVRGTDCISIIKLDK